MYINTRMPYPILALSPPSHSRNRLKGFLGFLRRKMLRSWTVGSEQVYNSLGFLFLELGFLEKLFLYVDFYLLISKLVSVSFSPISVPYIYIWNSWVFWEEIKVFVLSCCLSMKKIRRVKRMLKEQSRWLARGEREVGFFDPPFYPYLWLDTNCIRRVGSKAVILLCCDLKLMCYSRMWSKSWRIYLMWVLCGLSLVFIGNDMIVYYHAVELFR